MKNRISKAMAFLSVQLVLLPFVTSKVSAAGFDAAAAQQLVSSYLDPLSNFLLIVCPTVAVVAVSVSFISWAMKDEDDRERSPFTKKVKTILFACVLVSVFSLLLKIFGITVSTTGA